MHVTKIVQFDWSAVFESLWLHRMQQRSIRYKFLERVSHP